MYALRVYDAEGEVHSVGSVKDWSVQYEKRSSVAPIYPRDFDELGAEFFSLGQDDSYYEKLNEFRPGTPRSYITRTSGCRARSGSIPAGT